MYVKASGDGYDLPYGCLQYKRYAHANRGVVFWNPNGTVISMDLKIAQVCYEPPESFEGKYYGQNILSYASIE